MIHSNWREDLAVEQPEERVVDKINNVIVVFNIIIISIALLIANEGEGIG